MRLHELGLLTLLAACGGRIDDGDDSGVDAGPDAKSDVIMKPDTSPPPPPCEPDTAQCKSASQCCSGMCNFGACGPPPPPPPPPCKPDGVSCASDVECCSNACNGTCGGTTVGCATSSTKKCDQCVAMSCCNEMIACNGDAMCSTWLSCVQNCEQQNQSAFTCSKPQSQCGPPSNTTESALFSCAQQSCGSPCTVD
jgi:hypothetical protein